MTEHRIIEALRRHVALQTPFRHQGRSGEGVDCSGVFVVEARALGIPFIDHPVHQRKLKVGELRGELDAQPSLELIGDLTTTNDLTTLLEPAALMLFRIGHHNGVPIDQHLALWTGSTMIHACLSAGKVVEHVMPEFWRKRLTAVFRITGGR